MFRVMAEGEPFAIEFVKRAVFELKLLHLLI